MIDILFKIKNYIYISSRKVRIFFLLILDFVAINFSLCLTSFVLYTNVRDLLIQNFNIFFLISTLYLILYIYTGQYRSLTKYLGSFQIYKLSLRNILIGFLLIALNLKLKISFLSVNFFFVHTISLTLLSGFLRIFLRDLIIRIKSTKLRINNVIIFGAGEAGAQLSAALRLENKYNVKAFVDDNKNMHNMYIDDISIISRSELIKIKEEVDQVILAIPSIKIENKKNIIKFLKNERFSVLQIPSISELASSKTKINTFKPILIEDVLGRERIQPFEKLIIPAIKNKVILVTGSGGSIGSELCRQIIRISPKKLILLEINEPSLYVIHQELISSINQTIDVEPILGSSTNINLIKSIFDNNNIDVVFHAAAYKHVPLVEKNFIEGIFNNVFSTKFICDAALRNNIEKFILISTDKAVRPSNVMGASKRLSEQIVQAFDQISKSQNKSTKFSMVRFGNVLGSSGSVVPLFKKQISKGGPITITHKNIIRYFMTIPEAVELVIQSSMLAIGGEVFLLDMGQPIKIQDLAEQMISLSGLTLKDCDNPNGDISIVYTGLRPGEKLYEELTIGKESKETIHPLIFKAEESFLSSNKLFYYLENLEKNIVAFKSKEIVKCLKELVPEWNPSEFLEKSYCHDNK